jgi:hypothetical protein
MFARTLIYVTLYVHSLLYCSLTVSIAEFKTNEYDEAVVCMSKGE